ncbi:MAG: ATP synthase F1 subunit delta [Muribaculaceae bacterium]|nr:ATP synthase F1 subunit delta [Bacteroidales bacterium]MBD5325174.1 ATP synthase F1 subunit delta [Bacteroides sp.]MDE6228569.1 ATP synthase F1 subunit delta [Muribaculaceae bacterium]MBD5327442.1 ATP synthase F1 subunit delta [Bacteroides sp.]MBD5415367.1 ATP synthase F1 subunit delta [Bacteroides sp.]
MDQGLIPRRYAKALYLLAAEKGSDAEVYEAMQKLTAAFDSEPEMQKAIANPHVELADKESLVAAATGSNALVADMVSLLARNRRLDQLRQIALSYVALYRSEHRIFKVDITSASPLQQPELRRIQNLVNNHLPANSTAEFTETVDPALIGGFTIAIDNELLDASVASDLKQLRLKLLSH